MSGVGVKGENVRGMGVKGENVRGMGVKGENVRGVGVKGGGDEGVQVCECDTGPLLLPWLPQVTLAIFVLLWVQNP